MKKTVLSAFLVFLALTTLPLMASANGKDACDAHQALVDEHKDNFPIDLGDNQRRLIDTTSYDSYMRTCTIMVRYEVPFQIFVDTVRSADSRFNERLARQFLDGNDGRDFIGTIVTGIYKEEYRHLDKMDVKIDIEVNFVNNERRAMTFRLL